MDKWLECNGQSVSSAVYPELFAVVGGSVPDYRGYFIRGTGGNSAALGVAQGDAIRNFSGNIAGMQFGYDGVTANGAFSVVSQYNAGFGPTYGNTPLVHVDIDPSRQVPTANENRPVNKAVRYLIRAKP